MPLFMCRECGCVENTACCNYWWHKSQSKPVVCSECDEETKQWHGIFNKKPAAGMLVDQDGHLWSTDKLLPAHYTIVGIVAKA